MGTYSKEFRDQVVELHRKRGRTFMELSREFNISATSISNWFVQLKSVKLERSSRRLSGRMTRMAEDRYNPLAAHEQAMDAAISRIGPDRGRLSDHEAEQIVTEEFSARGINIGAPVAASIAFNLLQPGWPFLHPFRALREGWRWRSN